MTVFILPDGGQREQQCEMCGVAVTHRETAGGGWYPVAHDAPCDRPCTRGGVPPDYKPSTVHDQNCRVCAAKADE
jgi:hypothetical protein